MHYEQYRQGMEWIPCLKSAIEDSKISDLNNLDLNGLPEVNLNDVKLLPVIPNPGKIFCIGLNYENHRAETKRPESQNPTIFTRFAESQTGHGDSIICPKVSEKLDYEGEMAIIIGKAGSEVDKLKEELKKITSKDVQLNIFEIKRPELDAFLVGNSIARQIENRISFRRAIKMAIAAAMRMNAEGIKIQISGRLNGAEMARSESYKEGRIPLSTFRADIDYAIVEAHTTYGRLGIRVWIMKGEVYGKRELSPLTGMKKSSNNSKKNTRQSDRKK